MGKQKINWDNINAIRTRIGNLSVFEGSIHSHLLDYGFGVEKALNLIDDFDCEANANLGARAVADDINEEYEQRDD